MKAISIKQPWASLVASGRKTIECRTWRTTHRGPLLICASKGGFELNDDGLLAPGGVALGVVELQNIRPMTKGDLPAAFLPDDWQADALKGLAWEVAALYKVEPFPVKGRLNLFDVDDALIKRLPDDHDDHLRWLRDLKD